MQTRPAPEPPVKFYKTIAISFLVITLVLLGVVIFTTTKKATITVMAKADDRSVNLVVSVLKQKDTNKAISGTVSSTIFSFSQTYFPASAKTVDGVAEGEIVIYNKTNVAQPLVKTTRFLTPTNILFRLKDTVLVPANGQITASVYADLAGKSGEITPSQFTIPGLHPDKQKWIYAENLKPMIGGVRQVKILTDEDIATAQTDFKQKITAEFLKQLNTASEWFNQKTAMILKQAITNSNKAGDEVTEFQLTSVNTLAYVLYNDGELSDLVGKEINSKIDLTTEKITAATAQPEVSLLSADPTQGTAQLSVTQNVTATLDANSERLIPQNFTGKNKDEIERYLLGLPHAAGADIQISPAWSATAPNVSERIKVIVKSIQ